MPRRTRGGAPEADNVTREGVRQPGAETRSVEKMEKVEKLMEKVEKVEKVEKLIAFNGQVQCQQWSCYLVAFHRETQGTFSTLLVPF